MGRTEARTDGRTVLLAKYVYKDIDIVVASPTAELGLLMIQRGPICRCR